VKESEEGGCTAHFPLLKSAAKSVLSSIEEKIVFSFVSKNPLLDVIYQATLLDSRLLDIFTDF